MSTPRIFNTVGWGDQGMLLAFTPPRSLQLPALEPDRAALRIVEVQVRLRDVEPNELPEPDDFASLMDAMFPDRDHWDKWPAVADDHSSLC